MKVRALRVAFLLLLSLFLGWAGFAAWCHVPLEDPATYEAVRALVLSRLDEPPREPNGFEPGRDMWGFPADPKHPAKLEAWRNLGRLAETEVRLEPLRRSLARQQAQAGDAVAPALDLYPELKQALDRPVFFSPTRLRPEDPVANFVAMRSVARGLAVLVGWLSLEGKSDRAVECSLLLAAWGARLGRRSSSLIEFSVASEISNYGCDLLIDLLNEEIGADAVLRARLDLPAELLARTLDHEMIFALNCLSELDPGPAEYKLGSFSRIPLLGNLYLQRERNLYINYCLRRRAGLERLQVGPEGFMQAQRQTWDVAFRGVLIDTRRPLLEYRRLRAKLAAVQTLACLQRGLPAPASELTCRRTATGYELKYEDEVLYP